MYSCYSACSTGLTFACACFFQLSLELTCKLQVFSSCSSSRPIADFDSHPACASGRTGIFPDRIGRVVIDGVVDPTVWQSGTEHAVLASTFRDTDKALENFVDHCLEVSPSFLALIIISWLTTASCSGRPWSMCLG